MLEILQDKDSSKVVLIKLGHFYIATGRDAVLLYKKLNLKCTCFKNNICKVAIPVNSLEKYVEKFNQMQYSYIIYDYDKQANKNTSNYMLEQLKLMNNIDAEMNCQRIYLRIMNKQKWIDIKRFDIAMNKIYEIGKIIGGLAKYYAKNN